MEVTDAIAAARDHLREQALIEERNGMHFFGCFADDDDDPTRVVPLECFRDDASQAPHLRNFRSEQFARCFKNFRISVYGNPPPSTIDRMLAHGYWPPALTGEFPHLPHLSDFMGFRG